LVWFDFVCLGVWVRGHYFEKRRIGVALHCRTLLVHWSGLHSTTLDDVRLDWVVTGLCVSVRLLPVLSYECLSWNLISVSFIFLIWSHNEYTGQYW
jgi:hypothetical protein